MISRQLADDRDAEEYDVCACGHYQGWHITAALAREAGRDNHGGCLANVDGDDCTCRWNPGEADQLTLAL